MAKEAEVQEWPETQADRMAFAYGIAAGLVALRNEPDAVRVAALQALVSLSLAAEPEAGLVVQEPREGQG